MKPVISFIFIFFIAFNVLAQNTCETAVIIPSLSYSSEGLTTLGAGNDYDDSDACGSAAMLNEDYVFSYTPSVATSIRISLSNTAIITEAPIALTATIGLFVVSDCPDQPTSSCVASVDDLTENPEIDLVNLNAGVTYYIIVSSAFDNLVIQDFVTYVNFDINIDEVFDNDAGVVSVEPIASACGLTTEQVSCEIKNFGTASITNFDVAFTVDGGTEEIETFSGTILPGATSNYSFTTLADISGIASHDILVYTLLTDDENIENDDFEISVTTSDVIANFPYSEGFESGFGDFYTGGTESSWETGSPAVEDPAVINYPAEGDSFAVTNLAGEANTGEISYLYSPCFDLTSLIVPTLKFSYWAELGTAGFGGTAELTASTDGGVTYDVSVATFDVSTGDWLDFSIALPDLTDESALKFRLNYTAGFLASEGIAIDNFILKEQNMIDATVGVLSLPVSGCGLTDSEYIKLFVINNGAGEIENIPVNYSIDNGTTWLADTETVAGPIAPGDSVIFTFSSLADMSAPATYQLVVKTSLVGDEEPDNDSRYFEIINTLSVDMFPYVEDFETENHSWGASAGSSWETGIPEDSLIINFAFSGDYLMATNPHGNADGTDSEVLISPCFDCSGLNGVRLSLAVWYETGAFVQGTAVLEGSADGGATWFVVDNTWTGSTGTWQEYSYDILEFADATNAKLRISYQSQILPAEGIAIDYVRIDPVLSDDLGITQILGPVSTCGLGDQESIQVEITNFGAEAQTAFPVMFSIDEGATWTTQNYYLQLESFQSTTFTFSSPVDFSTVGEYNVWVKTELSGDENTQNDALYGIIANLDFINTFPYQESFETGSNGWVASGTNSSLELGIPSATIINTAGEGDESWVTNLDGNHNESEISYLNGPCFDFSSMVNPMIKASINYETMALMSQFFMQYSIDGGASWDTIQPGGGGGNWYGAGLLPGLASTWNGSSAGWIVASTNIPELAGEGNVQLRFVFDSGMMPLMQNEGVGIDNIVIYDCDLLPLADFNYTVEGTIVTFSNISDDGTTYLWNFGDNEFLPTTSDEESPVFDYTLTGQYTVTLTVSNDCGSDEVSQIIDISTSSAQLSVGDIAIYPNPVENHLTVNTGNLLPDNISIVDINGKIISEFVPDSNISRIETSNLCSGLYLVKVSTEKGVSYLKFIKQ